MYVGYILNFNDSAERIELSERPSQAGN